MPCTTNVDTLLMAFAYDQSKTLLINWIWFVYSKAAILALVLTNRSSYRCEGASKLYFALHLRVQVSVDCNLYEPVFVSQNLSMINFCI